MQSPPFLRIGSRGSPLALVQARLVQRLLADAHGVPVEAIEIRSIATSGDKLTDAPLSEFGEKIGVAFQLIDDVLDLAGELEKTGKTPGTDLRSGVSTLPLLYLRL